MKHKRLAGLVAGFLCLVLAAPAVADPANVAIRIEDKDSTIVEETFLRTNTAPVVKDGTNACTGTSVAGALEQAVQGDWDGPWYDTTYFVERIRGGDYPFGETPDGWSYYVNNRDPGVGMCDVELQEGDDVVFFVSRCEFDPDINACSNPPVQPLGLSLPSGATAGESVTADVVAYDGTGASAPVDGARIAGDGIDLTTVNGRASVIFPRAGTYRLKADKAGASRSAAETVTVVAPGQPLPPPVAEADKVAPLGKIVGIKSGQRFKRKKAPRTLRGSVAPDPAGLRAVKLSLTRSRGGRCQLYSKSLERFRNSKCGKRVNFAIGDRQEWSYLLPKRLGKGRYVLDVIAVDKLGNRDSLARGRNRVVFHVR